MSYFDEDRDGPRMSPPTEDERREGRRMFALNTAVNCRGEYSTTKDVLGAAAEFLAFVEATP